MWCEYAASTVWKTWGGRVCLTTCELQAFFSRWFFHFSKLNLIFFSALGFYHSILVKEEEEVVEVAVGEGEREKGDYSVICWDERGRGRRVVVGVDAILSRASTVVLLLLLVPSPVLLLLLLPPAAAVAVAAGTLVRRGRRGAWNLKRKRGINRSNVYADSVWKVGRQTFIFKWNAGFFLGQFEFLVLECGALAMSKTAV